MGGQRLNALRIIDKPILWIVERGAHFIQRTFGIPPIAIARVLYATWIVSTIVHDVASKRGWLAYWWVPLALVYYVFGFELESRKRQSEALNGYRNYARENGADLVLRLVILWATILPPYSWSWSVQGGSITLSCYLRACDTLPPGISRVRNLWNALTRVSVQRTAQESA